jgi:hypothetical protein
MPPGTEIYYFLIGIVRYGDYAGNTFTNGFCFGCDATIDRFLRFWIGGAGPSLSCAKMVFIEARRVRIDVPEVVANLELLLCPLRVRKGGTVRRVGKTGTLRGSIEGRDDHAARADHEGGWWRAGSA